MTYRIEFTWQEHNECIPGCVDLRLPTAGAYTCRPGMMLLLRWYRNLVKEGIV
jgi:hypothetical protein